MVVDWKERYKDEEQTEQNDDDAHRDKRVKFFNSKDLFRDGLEAVVGHVSAQQLELLRQQSSEDVQQAVNLYLDTSGKLENNNNIATGSEPATANDDDQTTVNGSQQAPIELVDDDSDIDHVVVLDDEDDDMIVETQGPSELALYKSWHKRFIGSFQATIWATRSGSKLVEFGEKLDVKRSKSDPKTRLSNTRPVNPGDNIIVRLAKRSNGLEIARLSEADARFAAALIDSGLCEFSATCIYADDHVRLGSTMVVQVDCFLLRSAFYTDKLLAPSLGSGNNAARDVKVWLGQGKETSDDKFMRLRQNGLVNLFNKLNVDTGEEEEKKVKAAADLADLNEAAEAMGTQMPEQAATELDQDQLDNLYKRSVAPDTYLDESQPPDTFALDLRPYQKKGLTWMKNKESSDEDLAVGSGTSEPLHPLWRRIKWPSQKAHLDTRPADPNEPLELDDSDEFYVNLYSGELSLSFPRQHKSVLGGILADEMGLGKTISTMALVHSNKFDPTNDPDATRSDYAKYTTLVVAPMSLLSQWESEVYASSHKGSMRALVYYGSAAGLDLKTLLCSGSETSVPNVVITSYGTLLSEHGALADWLEKRNMSADENTTSWQDEQNLQRFGLFGVKFYRVVLDEGHTIRNRAAKTSKAAYALRAARRWVLTGTPIVNQLDDLYSIVKFLCVEPWNNYPFWKAFISSPAESKGFVQAMHVVQSIMEPLVLRRTKDMKQPDGTPLVQLPPKTVTIQRVKFTEEEEALYRFVYSRARNSFQEGMESGNLMRSYSAIFAIILRLRQVCCHPALVSGSYNEVDDATDGLDDVKGSGSTSLNLLDMANKDLKEMLAQFTSESKDDEIRDASSYGSEVMKNIVEGSENNCPLCLEPIDAEQQALTACWHMACLDCILQQIRFQKSKNQSPRCATCRAGISADKIYQVKRRGERVMLQRYHNRGQSSKVKELIAQLHQHYKSPDSKKPVRTVVFSQFTSYLTIIQRELTREGFHCLRFDGSMSQRKRAEVLEEFKTGAKSVVLLISLKAGGVGLNLVCANRAYLMDPWWSYAVEAQAIDRIHRMGQLSEVQVTRFIIEGTVEERMLKIQDRKKFLATTLGMSEEEKRAQRLDDIKLLFDER